MFVEGWSDVQFTKSFLEGLNDDVTRSITALEIGQLLKFDTFYNRLVGLSQVWNHLIDLDRGPILLSLLLDSTQKSKRPCL